MCRCVLECGMDWNGVLQHSESEVHMSGGGIFHASGGPLDGPKARNC